MSNFCVSRIQVDSIDDTVDSIDDNIGGMADGPRRPQRLCPQM